MNVTKDNASSAYLEAKAQKAALGHQLFELLTMDNWYGTLQLALRSHESRDQQARHTYYAKPDFGDLANPSYLWSVPLERARRYKATALGVEWINDELFKELVEEVLREELEKYNVELRWAYQKNQEDRVLCVYLRF